MDELAQSLTNRITRDSAYFVGGGTIIASYCIALGIDTKGFPDIAFVLLGGIAYVLGFAFQEVFSFCPLFSNSLYIKTPCCVLRHLYKWHTGKEWCPTCGLDIFDARRTLGKLSTNEHQSVISLIERTATLKHLGSSIGPCFLISGFLLFAGRFIELNSLSMRFSWSHCRFSWWHAHIWASLALLAWGAFLIILGRLKTMQQIRYLSRARSY